MAARFPHRFFPVRNPLPSATTLRPAYNFASFITEYLQRRASIGENRTPENFTFYIPEHLKHLLAAVIELPEEDTARGTKIALAKIIVLTDLIQYENTLTNILREPDAAAQYPGIDQSILDAYQKRAKAIRRFIRDAIGAEQEEQPRQLPRSLPVPIPSRNVR